ncbi:hypothetical protein [Methylorubrum populi]|uniref:hypothetical protein n=1 Tax=Methylorubrum populi TaxID=223967 RepID=UPI003F656283
MDIDGTCPASNENSLMLRPSEWDRFDVEVKVYDALDLVKQAADTIHDLQRWKETIEPQALSLIQSVQQERARWQVESSALMAEISECRLTITATRTALRTALSDREALARRCQDAGAAVAASEQRASAAEALLAFLYKTFALELTETPSKGPVGRPFAHPAASWISPK